MKFRVAVMALAVAALVAIVAASAPPAAAQGPSPQPAKTFRKRVLAWADVRNGYQHDAINHAIATIEQLGWQ